jgi:hypothetical protein
VRWTGFCGRGGFLGTSRDWGCWVVGQMLEGGWWIGSSGGWGRRDVPGFNERRGLGGRHEIVDVNEERVDGYYFGGVVVMLAHIC